MAAQALMPWLEAEAKERLQDAQERGRTSRWTAPTSEQSTDATIDPSSRHGLPSRAATEAAKLAGVGHSIIYEAKRLAERAAVDPQAAASDLELEARLLIADAEGNRGGNVIHLLYSQRSKPMLKSVE